MLTQHGKHGKLFKAKSKKQSRVSTLTIAQAGDYWSDIETRRFIIDLIMLICKWIVSNCSLFFCERESKIL